MKALMINGSPNKDGCTNKALEFVADSLKEEGIEIEVIQLGKQNIQDCTACGFCHKDKKICVFDKDPVNDILNRAEEFDAIVIGTPVYYSHPSGNIISFLNRLFFSSHGRFKHKVGASVVSARRAGTTSTLDVINKHFLISNMFVSGSSYWNMIHGMNKEEVLQDEEGIQTMYNLGKNIAYLVKCMKESKIDKPQLKRVARTNFIR